MALLKVTDASPRPAQGMLSFGAKPKALSVQDVFAALRKIAEQKGNNSQQLRVDIIKGPSSMD
jgi:hypothetical protein